MDKISVIIPTYNRSQKLKESITSVLRQSYTDFEILIVDDGSEDDTEEVVEAIQDKRIRYIKLPVNQGVSAARNEGVRQAMNPLIAFHDSDDIWRPDKLAKQMAYWQQHPEYSMIYCAYLMHNGKEEWKVPGEAAEGLEGKIFPRLLLRNSVGAPTMLLKRKCFLEAGGFDISLKSLEDWDFTLRFSEKFSIGYVNEILVDAYYSMGGISSGVSAYYKSRCMLIARYREEMIARGIFDLSVTDLFRRAEKSGMLEEVKKMLLLFLGGSESAS